MNLRSILEPLPAWLIPLALILLVLFGLTGCNTLQPNAFPREYAPVIAKIGESLADQAVWQTITANIDGQVIEPGIEAGAGVMYIAYGKLSGVSGQVGFAGVGGGTGQQSPEAQAVIRALQRSPDLIEMLYERWKIEHAAANPPATQPGVTVQDVTESQ